MPSPRPEAEGKPGYRQGHRLTLAEVRRRLSGRSFGRLSDLSAGLMMLGMSGLGILYAANVPNLDPITIWPFGFWAALFAGLGLVLAPLLRRRRTVLVVGYALLIGLALTEEPWFVLRGLWHDPRQAVSSAAERGDLLRVVSLNCGGGNELAIDDALALAPDIILLQESPGSYLFERTLPDGWEHAGQIDSAVLVRGTLYPDELPRWLAHEMHVVRAVPSRLGRPLTAISTHIVQPELRTDIWRPEVWRHARSLRESRMAAIQHILQQRDRYGSDLPVVVGGDFNTPAGDPLLEPLLANGLTDAFRAAGHGWPNTITSDYPMERIDFIFTGRGFKPLDAFVAVTPHSDHRMVVADLALE